MKPFTVVSLFAGCGGSSLGYELAGGKVLLAVEWHQNAADTYRLNHPGTIVFKRDIAGVSSREILEATGLQVGELDILDGSPPCQGFSTLGKRKVSDPRNQLFREYARLLQDLQPKVLVMENVFGLSQGRMKVIFKDILQTLRDSGYHVKARLMNAQYYGVPQRRRRIVFIGVRQDLGLLPSHPNPQQMPILLKDALEGLDSPSEVILPKGTAAKLAECIQPGEDGSQLRRRLGGKMQDYSLKRLSWHEVAPTLCNTIRPGQCGFLHPDESRYLSIPELKRIATFPDEYRFTGPLVEQWGRIGNSVPPFLMKAVAENIRDHILAHLSLSQSRSKKNVENLLNPCNFLQERRLHLIFNLFFKQVFNLWHFRE